MRSFVPISLAHSLRRQRGADGGLPQRKKQCLPERSRWPESGGRQLYTHPKYRVVVAAASGADAARVRRLELPSARAPQYALFHGLQQPFRALRRRRLIGIVVSKRMCADQQRRPDN